MKELNLLLGIKGNPSTAYHLQTDGQTEHVNWEVRKYLRMFTNFQQDDWADWLPLAEFVYNNAVHESTGQTPFFLNRGQHPQMMPEDPPMETRTMAGGFLEAIQAATKMAEESLVKAKRVMKAQWEKSRWPDKQYKEGDLVLVMAEHLPTNWPSKKLDQKWHGPFAIVRKCREAAYELDLLPHWKGHWMFNATQIKKFEKPAFLIQEQLPTWPKPELVDKNPEYKVQEIIGQRQTNLGKEFLVQWEGYGPKDDTWELERNLTHARGALWDFLARGRATKRREYHVMASVMKDIQEGGAYNQTVEPTTELTERTVVKPRTEWLDELTVEVDQLKGWHELPWVKDESDRLDSRTTHLADQNGWDTGSRDTSVLTGKLCRRVMVLIQWKVGTDKAVMEHMVRALEQWLHNRGISIYMDLV
jgi:hypothetical protein